jgi:hypothetical protein
MKLPVALQVVQLVVEAQFVQPTIKLEQLEHTEELRAVVSSTQEAQATVELQVAQKDKVTEQAWHWELLKVYPVLQAQTLLPLRMKLLEVSQVRQVVVEEQFKQPARKVEHVWHLPLLKTYPLFEQLVQPVIDVQVTQAVKEVSQV